MAKINPYIAEDLTRLRDELIPKAFNEDSTHKDREIAAIVYKINSCLYKGYPRREA